MPAPDRLINRSIACIMRAGYSRARAHRLARAIVATVGYALVDDSAEFRWWLDELADAARRIEQAPPSPPTSRQESEHGDIAATTGPRAEGPGQGQA